MAVPILYESESFIVVNKPHDMYINSDDPNEKNTVACHIGQPDSHLSTSSQQLHFTHRLDYATSGALCLARSKAAAARVCRLFERRKTSKYYLAVLRGHVPFQLADVRYDVGTDESPLNSHKMVAVTSSATSCGRARAAHTRLAALGAGRYHGEPVTLALMKPATGRRHQLRVHCHALGHTILGDYTYSGRADTAPHRMFLHAARLVLPLPDEPLDIRTPEPFFSDPQFANAWQDDGPLVDFEVASAALDSDCHEGFKYSVYEKCD